MALSASPLEGNGQRTSGSAFRLRCRNHSHPAARLGAP
jgi:hypothetical protein